MITYAQIAAACSANDVKGAVAAMDELDVTMDAVLQAADQRELRVEILMPNEPIRTKVQLAWIDGFCAALRVLKEASK